MLYAHVSSSGLTGLDHMGWNHWYLCIFTSNIEVWGRTKQLIGEEAHTATVLLSITGATSLPDEIQASKKAGKIPDEKGRVPIACSMDGGWQQAGSRWAYDSPSGHNIGLGSGLKKF